MHLCIEFQEKYKCLDSLCKDCYSSKEGVSEYIRIMGAVSYNDRYLVESWDYDYNLLKHMRWVRNQLAHEIGSFESGICTEDDLSSVNDFYQILSGNDPLTLLRRAREAKNKTENIRKTEQISFDIIYNIADVNEQEQANKAEQKNRTSLLHKIITQIKACFKK